MSNIEKKPDFISTYGYFPDMKPVTPEIIKEAEAARERDGGTPELRTPPDGGEAAAEARRAVRSDGLRTPTAPESGLTVRGGTRRPAPTLTGDPISGVVLSSGTVDTRRRAAITAALTARGDDSFGGNPTAYLAARRTPDRAQASFVADFTALTTPAEQRAALALALPRLSDGRNSSRVTTSLRTLQGSPGFGDLNPAHRAMMEELLRLGGGERAALTRLTTLAGSEAFRNLNDATKTILLAELARVIDQGTSPRAESLLGLAQAPGFGRMTPAQQQTLLRLVGNDYYPISANQSLRLNTLLGEDAFRRADAAGQATQLRDFVINGTGATHVMWAPSRSLEGRPAEYRLEGPTDVAEFAFRSGKAPARRYEVVIGDQRIPVHMPTSTPTGLHQHSIEDVARGLALMDPLLRANIRQVNVNPGENPDDPYWRTQYNNPHHRSYMTAGADGVISFYPTDSAQSWQTAACSMIHEVGHIISHQRWGHDYAGANYAGWRAAIASDLAHPSRYARNSVGEDFAESLQLYMQVRGQPEEQQMRALYPERFRLLDEFMEHLRTRAARR